MHRDHEASPRRSLLIHAHGDDCGCGHDHAHRMEPRFSGAWAALAPVLACAVCPACVSTYAKAFAIVGVGAALSARQHLVLLAVAVSASIAVSAYRTWRSQRAWPLVVALAGCGVLVTGHLLDHGAWLEWSGMATLVVGGLLEQRAARRRASGTAALLSRA
jgi:hypothetical protein